MTPETRTSLLLRVRDPGDQEAWTEFVEIYAPVIERMAIGRGLQPVDAEDLVQQVMISISRAVEKRPHDPERAKFRTWLRRVAENAILNALTRKKPDRGSGRTDFVELLAQHSAPEEESALLRRECEEQIFRWAADRIRPEFTPATWDAFWCTAVNAEEVETVARRLQKNVGSIYAARSRVMKRLRDEVRQYES